MAYLTEMRQDKSQYPYNNVMSCDWLIRQLKKHNWDKKAEAVQAVIDKGLNSYASTKTLSPNSPVIEPMYFIQVIQRKDEKIMDRRDTSYGDDQNIGLHDLASQPTMHQITTNQRVTINGQSVNIPLDYGFCPFCAYHSRCHKTLNNHVRMHLQMPMSAGLETAFMPPLTAR